MTAWSFLAPLWRALTGGRTPVRFESEYTYPFEAEWANVLVELGLPVTVFRAVLEADSLAPHFHYRHFTRPKKDGGRRELAEPDPRLKRVQQAIVNRYLTQETPHPAAVAYRPGLSIADHVWQHAGAEFLVTADIRDFFPNTLEARVESWWRERTDEASARVLTLLTTYRGALPQGAPTSPPLSNLVNRDLDERLAQRAQAASGRYSRYCDDLCFSWREQEPASDFERSVRATLHAYGYALHPEKGWCVHRRSDEPEITGVILTRHGGVRLPERLQRVMAALAVSTDPRDVQRLKGYRGYRAMVVKRPKRRTNTEERQNASVPVIRALPPALEPMPSDEDDGAIPF